jgi:hypothetical protein
MGIFSDRRGLVRVFDRFMMPADVGESGDEWLRTDAVRWEPFGWSVPGTLLGAAADMNDDGQAGWAAYKVIFTSPSVPGAEITVCTYAAEGQGSYWKGIRYTYTTTAAPDWSFTLWEKDPEDQAYGGVGAADTAALDLALRIARNPDWARATLTEIFDWDGRRFDTAARDSDGAP